MCEYCMKCYSSLGFDFTVYIWIDARTIEVFEGMTAHHVTMQSYEWESKFWLGLLQIIWVDGI